MSAEEDSMARFDRVMRGILAVPKDEALKTMKKTLAEKKKRTRVRAARQVRKGG